MEHNRLQYQGNDGSCDQRDLARHTKLPQLRSMELGEVYPVQTKMSKNAQINVQNFTQTKKRTNLKKKLPNALTWRLYPRINRVLFFDFMDRH
jgi:hypothetical protein